MKTKILLISAILLFSLNLAILAYAQTGTVYLKEDFNYSNLDQMQTAGWTFTRPAGISASAGTVILDGKDGDCAMHYSTSFSDNVYDWKTETRSMWLGHGHSVLSVFIGTERHSYGFAADGYYKEFSFYRDSVKILHFGTYAEKANQYIVLTMVRQANTFSFYFNGELLNTYTEKDTVSSKVTSLEMVSPWRGDAKYDYYQLGEPTADFTSSPTESTNNFPMIPVLVGGGIVAIVIVGVFVYYFVIAGSGAGAAAGSTAAGTGAGGSGSSALIHNHPTSPLNGEAPISPLSGESSPYGTENLSPDYYDNNYYDQNQYDPSQYDLTQMYSESYANNASIDDTSAYYLQDIEAQHQAYMQAQSQTEYSQSADSNYSNPIPESEAYSAYETNQYFDPASNNYYDPNQPGTYDPSPYEINDAYTDPYANANYATDQYPQGTYDNSTYEQAAYEQAQQQAQQQASSNYTP